MQFEQFDAMLLLSRSRRVSCCIPCTPVTTHQARCPAFIMPLHGWCCITCGGFHHAAAWLVLYSMWWRFRGGCRGMSGDVLPKHLHVEVAVASLFSSLCHQHILESARVSVLAVARDVVWRAGCVTPVGAHARGVR
jgi:hypothetical protein